MENLKQNTFLFQPDWEKWDKDNDFEVSEDYENNETDKTGDHSDILVNVIKLPYNRIKKYDIWFAVAIYLGDGESWGEFTAVSMDKLRMKIELEFSVNLSEQFKTLQI